MWVLDSWQLKGNNAIETIEAFCSITRLARLLKLFNLPILIEPQNSGAGNVLPSYHLHEK